MKTFLLVTGLLLAGCHQRGSDPASLTPIGAPWVLTASTVVNLNNGTTTTTQEPVLPHTVTLQFGADGTVTRTLDQRITPTGVTTTTSGTYTLSGGMLTLQYPTGAASVPYWAETATTFTEHSLTLVHTDGRPPVGGRVEVSRTTTYVR
jgi:hypothetical protein